MTKKGRNVTTLVVNIEFADIIDDIIVSLQKHIKNNSPFAKPTRSAMASWLLGLGIEEANKQFDWFNEAQKKENRCHTQMK